MGYTQDNAGTMWGSGMNVLFAAVEMSPLAKVGGLGDVAGSLPRALRRRDVDVRVAMPMHGAIERTALSLTHILNDVRVAWAGGHERVDVWLGEVRDVPVYLLEHEAYFRRPNVYGYEDDVERFLFFCDALLACAAHLGFVPDVVHAQDWHSALALARLAGAGDAHRWADAGRVYTIHNLALQGGFDAAFARRFALDVAHDAIPDGLATADARRSAMAQGIWHADRVNTVSDTYAREIMTPEYGAGLASLLLARADVVSGIVNGIDYEEFDPRSDPAIVRNYGVETIDDRAENKRALQDRAGLPVNSEAMLCGVVTRLFAQKGIDLVPAALDGLLSTRDVQLVVLGTGDPEVHRMLEQLQEKHPDSVKCWFAFDPPLGQQVYAGCDIFLMPSRYEPCGLGQLISLRYGAVPLVRRTGGLADTVQDVDSTLSSGTGFVFDAPNATDLQHAIERALIAFGDRDRDGWSALQQRGMSQDWSWDRAAGKYIDLYRLSIEDRARAREQAEATT
jgi:starch synthase